MLNSRLSLDGTWEFRHGPDIAACNQASPREIAVPGPWQAQFEDLRQKAGYGRYRRDFDLPAGWAQGRIFLCFGGVFHNCVVQLNGERVGTHESGFLPFRFDVTDHVRADDRNHLDILVESPLDDPAQHPESPLGEIPVGKQSWYGPQSGIWQSVFLERRDPDHVQSVRLAADLPSGRLEARAVLSRKPGPNLEIDATVHDPAGEVAATFRMPTHTSRDEMRFALQIPNVEAWSPDRPALYRLTIVLRRAGEAVDRYVESFGFRTFEAHEGRFYLNGQPIYLRGALDQDYYPDSLGTLPDAAMLEDQMRKAKALGLNCLRLHIKAPDPRYYDIADRLGLLVWSELPNGGRMSRRARARAEALLKGIVDRDGNHPSLVIWTIINENWGTDLVHDAGHRAWLKQTYSWLKAYDPGRLVVDNSPLAPSIHVQTDIADYHYYAAIPDHRDEWDAFVDGLASRPDWLFTAEGDAVTTGEEPLVCSEFGNWGLPDPAALADPAGREPWWFETGHDWADGAVYPHGVGIRFADWSLDRVFGSLRGLVEAAQWQQYRALKYQIESMRRRPELAGYVITEMTDCHWESNGLLDMRRNTRVFHSVFAEINADTVIVPKWTRTAFWSEEVVTIGLAVAHGSGDPLGYTRLEIRLGRESRSLEVPSLAAGEVADLGWIEITAPRASQPGLYRVELGLRRADGTVLATNYVELAVQPHRRHEEWTVSVGPVWSNDEAVRAHLHGLGYTLACRLDDAAVAVASASGDDLAEYVREGGRALLLQDRPGRVDPYFPHWQNVHVRNRDGTLWRGDWASSFAWLSRLGCFSGLPGGPLLDDTFDRVLPRHVIVGCTLQDFQARVHGGLFVGWVHKPVALAVERSYGDGRLVLSTFRLFRDPPGTDPTASVLLDGLVGLVLGRSYATGQAVAVDDAA